MRLCDLYDASVRTGSGEQLGRVHEVVVENGRVKELGVGAENILERLMGRRRGHHVKWERVKAIKGGTIVVED
jgi:sporulation protein YlmC with PRC-barrel domain